MVSANASLSFLFVRGAPIARTTFLYSWIALFCVVRACIDMYTDLHLLY